MKFRTAHRFFALLVLSIAAWSQAQTGSVKGVLADSSGGVIPAATVTLPGVGVSKTAQTQADGSYTFPGLGPGQYTVTISFPGFAPFSKTVAVAPGSAATHDPTLERSGARRRPRLDGHSIPWPLETRR